EIGKWRRAHGEGDQHWRGSRAAREKSASCAAGCERRQRMGKRPCDSSNALGQRNPRARSGIQVSRPEQGNYHVLRRRLSVYPYGGGCAKDGLPECFFAQRRLQGPATSRMADEEWLRSAFVTLPE